MDLFKFMYWDSQVYSLTDSGQNLAGQFRVIGLEMRLGVRLSKELEIGYYHFSKHQLDNVGTTSYPLEDAIEVKLNLFKSKEERKPLLNF